MSNPSAPSAPSATPSMTPAVLLTYGKSKSGKTTSAGYSFPRGLFVARPDQVKSIVNVCGYSPSLAPPVKVLSDITRLITQLAGSKVRDQFDAIVVDDTSIISDATLRMYESQNRNNGYGAYGSVKDDVYDLRGAARDCGLHVSFNFHQREPEVKEGKFMRGGPALPSKNLTDMLPVIADTVLRADIDLSRIPWAGVYVCDPTDNNYVSGDRNHKAPKIGPMNEAELLRATGYTIRRLPGLEWQDAVADEVAGRVLESVSIQEVARKIREAAEKHKWLPAHALWALRDGIDRAEFIKHKRAGGWGAYGI